MDSPKNPFGFFTKPTAEQIAEQREKEAAYNLRRYGKAEYSNDREEAAWKLVKDNEHLPIGPEREAMADHWLKLSREARRIDNIEAARHREKVAIGSVSFAGLETKTIKQPPHAEILRERAKARAAEVQPMKYFSKKRDEQERDR